MSRDYFAAVTLLGQAKIAAAIANAGTINISAVAVGDGNGAPVTPVVTMTGLVHEVWRGPPTSVTRDPAMPTQVLVQVTIPASVAPATVRELALFTDDGQCIVVANYPATDLVASSQGAINTIDVLIPIVVDTAADVTIQVNAASLVPLAQLLRAPFIAVDSFAAAPPANPAVGALVVVGAAPTGGFANRAHQFAQWTGALWLFCQAYVDTIIGNGSDHKYYRRTATGWSMIPLGELPLAAGEGIRFGAETTPRVNLAYPALSPALPAAPDLFSFYSQAGQKHVVITWENLIALLRTAVNYVETPAPVAANFAANGMSGVASTINASAHVSGGFTSIAIINAAGSGATIVGGTITVPAATAAGVYAVTFRATGPGGVSNVATMTYTQAAFVAAPVVASFAVSGTNGTAASVALLPRITGSYASVAIVDAVGSGATITGTTLAIPAATAAGTYAITYRATGQGGVSNTGTITLTQAAFIAAPVASGFSVFGTNGTVSTVGLASHIFGDYTSVSILNAAGSGASISGSTVTIPATTPAGNYAITFQATGPGGVSNVATLSFSQAAYVAPPSVSNRAASGTNGTATTVALAANIAGSYTSVAIINASGSGATISGTTVTVPATTAAGTYAITFQATGQGGASNVATLTFTQAAAEAFAVGSSFSGNGGIWIPIFNNSDIDYVASTTGNVDSSGATIVFNGAGGEVQLPAPPGNLPAYIWDITAITGEPQQGAKQSAQVYTYTITRVS